MFYKCLQYLLLEKEAKASLPLPNSFSFFQKNYKNKKSKVLQLFCQEIPKFHP